MKKSELKVGQVVYTVRGRGHGPYWQPGLVTSIGSRRVGLFFLYANGNSTITNAGFSGVHPEPFGDWYVNYPLPTVGAFNKVSQIPI